MDDHAGALGLGDRARVVVRIGVDHEQLVDERHPLHQLASRGAHDGSDRRRLVERGQHGADGDALLLFELDEPAQIGELRVVVGGLAEPAVDPGGHAAALLGGPIGGLERLGLLSTLLEGRLGVGSRVLTTMTDGRACWATVSGSTPKRAPSLPATSVGDIAVAPMTTSCAPSASLMIDVPTLKPSTSSGWAGSVAC